MKAPTHPDTLLNRAGVASALEVSRQRVNTLKDEDPEFPAPFDVLDDGRTPIWMRRVIEEYHRGRSRVAGRPKS